MEFLIFTIFISAKISKASFPAKPFCATLMPIMQASKDHDQDQWKQRDDKRRVFPGRIHRLELDVAMMKKKPIIVNVSRGDMMDEDALLGVLIPARSSVQAWTCSKKKPMKTL